MSTTVDERVVEMRFDNKQFETNVQTSLSTLDKLKQSLDLDGAAKGLENLGDAAKKCDFSTLSSSVETVRSKFSALEVMAMTALSNITNSAVDAGKRLISQFTIEPITTGFNEYELKMGSIQTIMASTGESLDRVNQKLDELNTYSDKTIYSFSDMTTNIGKFTNAGVKLDDAVAAIQGVSNVAAVSGANANEASRAMYNFAQALSAGYVKLIDWKSIENANMATVEFKDQLLEAAVAAGTVEKTTDGMYKVLTTNAKGSTMDDVIDATHMFNDSLNYQWMTTEVLTSTLKEYADETTDIGKKAFAAAQDIKTFSQLMDTLKESAQSGWAQTWQLFVGDFEEAKKTLTEFNEFFSNILDTSANARNELLGGALTSNWGKLKNEINQTGISVDDFKDKLRDVASESVDGLDQMIEEAGSFDATLSQGWLTTDIFAKTLDELANEATGTSEGIAALSDEQLKNAGYTEEQIAALRNLRAEANETTGAFGSVADTIANIGQMSGREMLFDSLLNALKGIQKIFDTLKGAWEKVFPPATSEQLYDLIQALHEFSENLIISDETADKISRTFQGLFSVLDIVKQAFSAVFTAISPLFGGLGSLSGSILDVTASFGDWLVGVDEAVKKGNVFNGVAQKISGFIEAVISKIKDFVAAAKEKFDLPGFELCQNLLERLQERFSQLMEFVKGLKDGFVKVFSSIGDAITNSGISSSVDSVTDKLRSFYEGVKKIGEAIFEAIGTLVNGIADKLSGADFSGVLDLLNGISFGAIAAALTKFVKGLKETTSDPGGVINTLKDLFTNAQGLLSNIKGVLDGVKNSLETWQQDIKADIILKIAGALAVLTASLVALSLIDSDKLVASLGAMSVMFVELIGSLEAFSKLGGDSKEMKKNAATMIEMSAAVLVLASALKEISDLDVGELSRGLIGIGGLMAELVAAFKILGSNSGTITKGASQMVVFSAAIKVLASACEDLSGLSWDEMARGLVGVGTLLAEVDVFLNTVNLSGKGMSTATGIVMLSAAIKVLASACEDFGEMSWGEIGKGLSSVGALLLEITAFTNLTGNAEHVISTGLALVEIAAAMKVFASAVSDFGSLSWEEIAKGLVAMGGALAEIAVAVNLMPKNLVSIGTGLVVVGSSLEIVADSLRKMGGMSWEEIAKGLVTLGGSLAELSIGLNLMNGTLGGSAAMLVAASALGVLTPVLLALGTMSWESIAKGLIALAGAFTVIGAAGAVLTPLVPTILGLSGALALIGAGAAGVGAGLLLIGTGLTAIATGITALAASVGGGATVIAAGLTAIVTGFASLIPAIAEQFGAAIVAFCQVITDGAPAIGQAVTALITTLVDVIVQCVPMIADGALQLIAGVLDALATYTPQIVDSLMQFLIGLIEGIARNMPELIQAAVDLLMSFFSGIVSALSGIDTEALLQGIAGIGLLTAIMAALSAVAGMVPGAMAGILGMSAVVAELALVLTAVGALAQIPGLSWLIGEGGKLLAEIGTAIGSFVGSIVGGFMSGISSQFPQIGADLSAFMTNVQTFIDGASSIGPEMLSGIKSLTEALLLITAADVVSGLTSWLTGGSSLTDFADQLVPFGEAMSKFSQSISDMDSNLVSKAAIAGKTLAEMASALPNSGGVAGFFAGENDMDDFGDQLVAFGESMAKFSDAVSGVDSSAVTNAAIAGKVMAEMADMLPNSGGVIGFFAGENDLSTFGAQLVPFGTAMTNYSQAVKGLDAEAVNNSAIAGKAMAELVQTLPKTGGAISFFEGENDLDTFGEQLISFGEAIKNYSLAVKGLDTEAVANSALAGRALSELANTLPNTGGIVSFFTGSNDLETFGEAIVAFGDSIKKYSDTISGIDSDAVTSSAIAAKSLAELQEMLPNIGGVVNFFTGGNDLETFAEGLKPFGEGMKAYSDAVSGIEPETITASVVAAQSLSELQAALPKVGGVVDFFTGGNDLETFAAGLKPFGEGMKAYSDAVAEMNPEAVSASVIAAQSLSELQAQLPSVGGVVDFFTGGNDLETFAAGLKPFGEGMKAYSDAISEIDPNAVTASVTAAQSLSELQKTLPSVGGVMEFFTGGNDLETFAAGLKPFGEGMKAYADAVAEINPEAVTASAIAAQSLSELQAQLPSVGGVMEFFTGGNDLETFSAGLKPFGEGMKAYSDAVAEMNPEAVTASAIAAQSLAELQATLPSVGGVMEFFTGGNDLETFAAGLKPFGEGMKAYADAVAEINPEAVTASTVAAQSLAELQNGLPSIGGVVSFFTGGPDLSDFGEKLVPFGEDLAAYSEAIKDVKPEAVAASANAAAALANLASGLPDISLFDQWFGGDRTLASFGDDIVAFGEDLGSYYSSTRDIDTGKLSGVITQVWSLVDLAKGMQEIDKSAFSNFGDSLNDLAKTGITGFTDAFYDSDKQVNSAVLSMLNAVSSSITSNSSVVVPPMKNVVTLLVDVVEDGATTMKLAVVQLMTDFGKTIRENENVVETAMSNVVTSMSTVVDKGSTTVTTAMADMMTDFDRAIQDNEENVETSMTDIMDALDDAVDTGATTVVTTVSEMMDDFCDCIQNNESSASNAMTSVLNAAVWAANDLRDAFEQAGQNAGIGFVNGIESMESSASSAGRSLGLAALNAAKKALDSHSPSREGVQLGEYFGEGLVIGIERSIDPVSKVTSGMIDTIISDSAKGIGSIKNVLSDTIQTVSGMLELGIESEPTIRPVVDLSNAVQSVSDLNTMFTAQRTLGLTSQASIALTSNPGSEPISVTVETDNVVAELRSLRSEMASMTERMEKLKIVLDTGTLVGEMAGPMDTLLGQRSTYKGRGI